jgi:hypothetical protein
MTGKGTSTMLGRSNGVWPVEALAKKHAMEIVTHEDGAHTVEVSRGAVGTTVPLNTWAEVEAFVLGYSAAIELLELGT